MIKVRVERLSDRNVQMMEFPSEKEMLEFGLKDLPETVVCKSDEKGIDWELQMYDAYRE